MKVNLILSGAVAITGVSLPIALSYILQPLLGVTALQAFVAGAALCSTSLGTTFTVLQTSGLSRSRLGVILAGAAMMDDVVGLVLVQIVSTLGEQPAIEAATILRPIGVSLAYAVLTPLMCKYIVRPLTALLQRTHLPKRVATLKNGPFWIHTFLLVAFVATSSFAGTSNLFAAYLAGACITWWYADREEQDAEQTASITTEVRHSRKTDLHAIPSIVAGDRSGGKLQENNSASQNTTTEACRSSPSLTGAKLFHEYYAPVVNTLLRPFFFASIGFSVPIAQMFVGKVAWKGMVYTMLMMLGKIACGLWLVRFTIKLPRWPTQWRALRMTIPRTLLERKKQTSAARSRTALPPSQASTAGTARREDPRFVTTNESDRAGPGQVARPREPSVRTQHIEKPQSLYPAGILGMAMVSRGEIGFLVSAIAQSSGLFNSVNAASSLFLIVTWAIMLCTVVGPVATGMLVKRVRRLQRTERQTRSGRQDPLGIWGIE